MSARAAATLAFVFSPVTTLASYLVDNIGRVNSLNVVRDGLVVVLSYGVARFAFAARSRARMTGRIALGALLLSAAMSTLDAVRSYSPFGAPPIAIAGILPGAVFRIALTTAYSALLARLVGTPIEAPSSEDADRAQAVAGAWVLLGQVPLFFVALVGLALEAISPWASLPHSVVLLAVLNFLVPAGFIAAAQWRIHARRTWLERVRTGTLASWRLVDGTGRAGDAAGLPHMVRVADGDVHTLVRVRDAEKPFREGETLEPVALVTTAGASPR
jgi:hypothetical protein